MKHLSIFLIAASALALQACCGCRCSDSVECAPESCTVMPVTGTWINLAWQDERNNYMNFQDENLNTDPEMWADKMRELHAIGVDYIAIDQVANERKAYYPSKLMEHHYPDGRKSPVDAIMDTCDELGMHVFMSCGWAVNQLDNVGDSAVVARQCEMMSELGALYGDRPSFYGWYLPMEDCLAPYLPDRSVAGINRLTARAHQVTPGKRTMVAPWGIYGADLDNPKFAANLAAIDVDIIAYQDEVGCVRDHLPMHRMKKNFRKLGEIHKNLDLEFWVNIENFTWDRGTNNWYSSLIPAEFGRYLSQIVGASQSGAKRIMSFSVYGIYDAPGSAHPLGQPVESNLAYANYQSWLAGDPHWKMLEGVFSGATTNDAAGCKVYNTDDAACGKARQSYLNKLTDGVFGYEDPACNEWVNFCGSFDVTIDLGAVRDVKVVAPRFLHYSADRLRMPAEVTVSVSADGENYTSTTVAGPHAVNDRHDCWTDLCYIPDLGQARYIRVQAPSSLWSRVFCDEIIVKY